MNAGKLDEKEETMQLRKRNSMKAKVNRSMTTKSTVKKRVLPRLPRPRPRMAGPLPPAVTTATTPAKSMSSSIAMPQGQPSSFPDMLSILDKIYYRNHTQHRAQHWWKSLGLLRKALRQLNAIQAEVERLGVPGSATTTADAVRRRLAREKQLQEAKMEAETWIREVLLGRCFLAFSGLVADEVFCSIGIVLVGVLGAVGRLVGLPREVIEVSSFRGVRVKETGGEREVLEERIYGRRVLGLGVRGAEDLGEVVERREGSAPASVDYGRGEESVRSEKKSRTVQFAGKKDMDGEQTAISTLDSLLEAASAQPTEKKTKLPRSTVSLQSDAKDKRVAKKKSKKQNAIDDLFGSLV